jgi:hypothetical protein
MAQMVNEDPWLDSKITMSELKAVCKALKKKKSPGMDQIPNEFYKFAPDSLLDEILLFFNRVVQNGEFPENWGKIIVSPIYKKKDPKIPSNYRPISLVNAMTKIFTSILSNRLATWCEEHNSVSQFQAAYQKRRGCVDHIFNLNSLIQFQFRLKKRKLYALFVDMSQAFDSVNHLLLWDCLAKLGISHKFVSLLKNLYSQAYAYVRVNNQFTNQIPITTGVLQGEILSPILFILYINSLTEIFETSDISGITLPDNFTVHSLLYADDIVLLADTKGSLQRKINLLNVFFKEKYLKVNLSKTKVVIFRKGGRISKKDAFYWDDQPVEVMPQYVYLGVPFSSSGLFCNGAEYFIKKGLAAISALWPTLTKISTSLMTIRLRLFDSMVKSVLSYALPVWGLRYLDNIERVQLVFLRRVLLVSRCTPGYMLRLESGLVHLKASLFGIIIKFWIKILKMENSCLLKKCYNSLLKIAEIKENYPYNWAVQIKNLLDSIGFSFVWQFQDARLTLHSLPSMVERVANISKDLDFSRMLVSTSFPWFKQIKIDSYPESYIYLNLPLCIVRTIAQIRLNKKVFIINNEIHSLHLDTNCSLCNLEEPEDWFHIFNRCPLYNVYREKLKNALPGFKENKNEFWKNFCNLDSKHCKSIFFFVKCATKYRTFCLEETN